MTAPPPTAVPPSPGRSVPPGAPDVFLSVVVPTYNEQERLADSLYALKEYLAARSYRSEVLVVDDGSSDLTTEIVKSLDIWHREIYEQEEGTLLENIKNVGKGFAVARGMIKARGRYVLFMDADSSTPIEEVERLLPYFDEGYSLVIGSRRMPGGPAVDKPMHRRAMSQLFHLAQSLAVPGIHDTQCGFKMYTRDAAHRLALLQRVYGFAFDVEHLYLARRLGLSIKEVPVLWTHKAGSKVDPLLDGARMLLDIAKIGIYHRGTPRLRQR